METYRLTKKQDKRYFTFKKLEQILILLEKAAQKIKQAIDLLNLIQKEPN